MFLTLISNLVRDELIWLVCRESVRVTNERTARLSSDLEVDLEELVAQKHHPPLLRVLDPSATAGTRRVWMRIDTQSITFCWTWIQCVFVLTCRWRTLWSSSSAARLLSPASLRAGLYSSSAAAAPPEHGVKGQFHHHHHHHLHHWSVSTVSYIVGKYSEIQSDGEHHRESPESTNTQAERSADWRCVHWRCVEIVHVFVLNLVYLILSCWYKRFLCNITMSMLQN